MPKVLASLAANTRRLRLREGLTQEGLAEAAGLSTKYVQQMEAAGANPSIMTVVALAEALGVEITELLKPARPPSRRRPGRPRKSR